MMLLYEIREALTLLFSQACRISMIVFFSYNAKSVDFNPGVGCIIRAIDGSMRKPDVSCVVVDQSNGLLQLSESEEIVSNIVCVKQTDEERKFSVS